MKRWIVFTASALVVGTGCFIAGMKSASVAGVTPDGGDDAAVRVVTLANGSREIYFKTIPSVLVRHKFSSSGSHISKTIFRLDERGNPMSAKVFNPAGEELQRIAYGYRTSDGTLVEERIFDPGERKIDPETGREKPVRRILHVPDETGLVELVDISLERGGEDWVSAPFHDPFRR